MDTILTESKKNTVPLVDGAQAARCHLQYMGLQKSQT